MKYIDLTHTISEEMPVYPGTEKPRLVSANTIEKDGFRETIINMYSHAGTHTDSPAHLLEGGKSLDSFPVSQFFGRAVMLDCTELSENSRITKQMLCSLGEKFTRADFLIIRTGWEKYWNNEKYFSDFPCLDVEAASFFAQSGKKGIGVDAISVDPVGCPLDVHRIILSQNNIVIIENLCNLDKIDCDEFEFCALPLKFDDSDGATTRATAIIK